MIETEAIHQLLETMIGVYMDEVVLRCPSPIESQVSMGLYV